MCAPGDRLKLCTGDGPVPRPRWTLLRGGDTDLMAIVGNAAPVEEHTPETRRKFEAQEWLRGELSRADVFGAPVDTRLGDRLLIELEDGDDHMFDLFAVGWFKAIPGDRVPDHTLGRGAVRPDPAAVAARD